MLILARAALAAIVLLASPAFAADSVQQGPLTLSGAFTRATLPNAPVGGGFVSIENTGDQADRLVSASSPVAKEVQIHEMAMDGDVMRMRRLSDGLELPAGETTVLKPGSYHLMMMGLNQPLVEGQTVSLTLTFEHAGSVDLDVPVLGTAADAPQHAGHH